MRSIAGLHVMWWGIRPSERPDMAWAQVAGAAHRMATVAEGLEEVARRRNATIALPQLVYHLEHYFPRVYEVRERALALVEVLAHVKLGKAKHPAKRAAVLGGLPRRWRTAGNALNALLAHITIDVHHRNRDTHHRFFSVGLVTASGDVYEPDDLLAASKDARQLVAREVRRTAATYADKARTTIMLTNDLLAATH